MARGFVIGLFVSAALTLVVCKLLDRRRDSAGLPAEQAAGSSGNTASPAAGTSGEIARLKSENEAALKKIADTRAAQAKAAEASAAVKTAKTANPWGKIARGLLDFMKKVKENPKEGASGAQDLMLEMIGLLGKIAKERGVTLGEALLTPEGLPALLAGAFEDADPPLTDAERLALQKFTADLTTGFDSLQADKANRTSLEQRLELMRNGLGASDALVAELGPEHKQSAMELKAMGLGMTGSLGGPNHVASGTPEQIRDDFAQHWAKTLKFEESQAAAFAPIVEEYMRAVDLATADSMKGAMATSMGGETKMILARMEAQVAAQKKIESTFTLTNAQKKALDGWTTSYIYWGGVKTTPTEPGK